MEEVAGSGNGKVRESQRGAAQTGVDWSAWRGMGALKKPPSLQAHGEGADQM